MTVLHIKRVLHRHRVKNVSKLVERVTVVSVHGAVVVVVLVAVTHGDGDAVTNVDAVQGQLPVQRCGGSVHDENQHAEGNRNQCEKHDNCVRRGPEYRVVLQQRLCKARNNDVSV